MELKRTREINKELKADPLVKKNHIRLLLLGSGESGKSTILKQMKLTHTEGFTDADRVFYRDIIFANTIQSMKTVLRAMEDLDISLSSENLASAELVKNLAANINAPHLPKEIYRAIEALRHDPGVEEAIFRNNEYQLNDSATYYFESVLRMAQSDYVPTEQDILRSRVKTTGITEMSFPVKDTIYKVFDVGGQRSERRKWIHCFENLNAVLFMVSLSEYDQVLREDETVNRLQESLSLFEQICNSRWFVNSNMILFLNKMDLLADKITRSPLELYLHDYHGPNNYEAAVSYFKKIFVDVRKEKDRQIYTHITCATDSRQMRFVLTALHDILVKNSLRSAGIL